MKKKFKLFGGSESKEEEAAEKKSVKSKSAYAKKEKSEPGEQKFACGGKVKKMAGGGLPSRPSWGPPTPMQGGGGAPPMPMQGSGGGGAPPVMAAPPSMPMQGGGGGGAPPVMAAPPPVVRPVAMQPSGGQPNPTGMSGVYKKGGSVTRGDGCVSKGHTKGRFV